MVHSKKISYCYDRLCITVRTNILKVIQKKNDFGTFTKYRHCKNSGRQKVFKDSDVLISNMQKKNPII